MVCADFYYYYCYCGWWDKAVYDTFFFLVRIGSQSQRSWSRCDSTCACMWDECAVVDAIKSAKIYADGFILFLILADPTAHRFRSLSFYLILTTCDKISLWRQIGSLFWLQRFYLIGSDSFMSLYWKQIANKTRDAPKMNDEEKKKKKKCAPG